MTANCFPPGDGRDGIRTVAGAGLEEKRKKWTLTWRRSSQWLPPSDTHRRTLISCTRKDSHPKSWSPFYMTGNYGEEKRMKILVVEPGKAPYVREIAHGLNAMQQVVGGPIQAVYPFQDSAALVCHEEGKLLKLPLNRALRTEDGTVYDMISGPFSVCGLAGDSFASLTEEQIQRYMSIFRRPEQFLNISGSLLILAG